MFNFMANIPTAEYGVGALDPDKEQIFDNFRRLNEEFNRVVKKHSVIIAELRAKLQKVKEEVHPLNEARGEAAHKAILDRVEASGKAVPPELPEVDFSQFDPSDRQAAILKYGGEYLGMIDTLTKEMAIDQSAVGVMPKNLSSGALIQHDANIEKIDNFLTDLESQAEG